MMRKLQGKLLQQSKAQAQTGVVLPAVQAGMLKDYGIDTSRRWDIIHPSELSHQTTFCPRAVYLRITRGPVVKDKFDFVRENIFAEGNDIHSRWQARLRKYTPLFGDWSCIVCGHVERARTEPEKMIAFGVPCQRDSGHLWEYCEITLDAERDALLVGHADGGFDENMVEFKSVGEGTVRIEEPELYRAADGDLKKLWATIDRPFKTHINQGDIYLWIANHMGYGFTKMAYVYESKWNQMVKEFVLTYNEDRSMRLIDQARAIKLAVENQTELSCRFPGKCKECKPYDLVASQTRSTRRTVQVRST